MPTYQYKCLDCGETFDYFQKMSDKPLTHCTCCKNGRVKRLISMGAGIIFKGSGFYETDYKRKAEKKSEDKHKENSSKSEQKSSETKKN